MKLMDIADYIENISPLDSQEGWDNSGFQVKLGNDEISTVLVAMEINGEVIEEAARKGAELIVTHHPLIFGGIKKVDSNDVTGKYVLELIKSGINVYSTHTPFDKCEGGNNDYLAEMLKLKDVKTMEEDFSGFCRVGYVEKDMTAREFIDQSCEGMKLDKQFVSFTGNLDKEVKKVGLCTGAGADFLKEAISAGCDLFVTGDVKYHTAQTAKELGLNLLDLGHFGTEDLFRENMSKLLEKLAKKNNLIILKSEVDLNPFVRI